MRLNGAPVTVARFRIAGDRLELLDEGGTVVARLRAVALR